MLAHAEQLSMKEGQKSILSLGHDETLTCPWSVSALSSVCRADICQINNIKFLSFLPVLLAPGPVHSAQCQGRRSAPAGGAPYCSLSLRAV